MKRLFLFCIVFVLFGCTDESSIETAPTQVAESTAAIETAPTPTPTPTTPNLDDIFNSQPDEVKARYPYRNPQQTLEFFGIEPGMTIVEVLPGGGWYTKLLLPYVGESGELIGVDYPLDLYPNFSYMTEEAIAEKETWVADWIAEAEGWRSEGDASLSAFQFAALPENMEGTADAVLFIRALHNLSRFDSVGGFLTTALEDSYRVLKPGGIVGVVQHQARDEMPDEWADGSAGYLKRSFIIERMEAVGFEYIDSTDINANPIDQPTVDDVVWRLPPSFSGSRNDPVQQRFMREIGESNRMTLKFRKPSS